jgi:hypothetical protein
MFGKLFKRGKSKPLVYIIQGDVTVAVLKVAEEGNYRHEYVETSMYPDLVAAAKAHPGLGDPFKWLYYPKERRFETIEVCKFELCKEEKQSYGCTDERCSLVYGCHRKTKAL